MGLKIEYSINKLRLIAATVRRGDFSTQQVEAFLSLYKDEIEERMTKTVRDFVQEKLRQ